MEDCRVGLGWVCSCRSADRAGQRLHLLHCCPWQRWLFPSPCSLGPPPPHSWPALASPSPLSFSLSLLLSRWPLGGRWMSGVYLLHGWAGWGCFAGGGGAAVCMWLCLCLWSLAPLAARFQLPSFCPHPQPVWPGPDLNPRLRMGRVLPSPLSLSITPPPIHPPNSPTPHSDPSVHTECQLHVWLSAGPIEAWVEKALSMPSWSQRVARSQPQSRQSGRRRMGHSRCLGFCCVSPFGGDHRVWEVQGSWRKNSEVEWQVEVVEGCPSHRGSCGRCSAGGSCGRARRFQRTGWN